MKPGVKATAGPRGGGVVNSCVGGAAEDVVWCFRYVVCGEGLGPVLNICGFFLFWTPKQKVFLGPPAKAKESTPLWAKDGVAGGVGDRL